MNDNGQTQIRLSVRIPAALVAKADRLAAQTHRTRSDIVRLLLDRAEARPGQDIALTGRPHSIG